MFYENLQSECKRQGLKISTVVIECGGAVGSIGGWKKGSIPNASIVIALALRLNVSTDYLLLGNIDKKPTNDIQETNVTECEMLRLFKLLPTDEQLKLLGRTELLVEQNEICKTKDVV